MLGLQVEQTIQVRPSTDINIAEYWGKRNWKIMKVFDNVISVQGINLNDESKLIQERHIISDKFALNYLDIQIIK